MIFKVLYKCMVLLQLLGIFKVQEIVMCVYPCGYMRERVTMKLGQYWRRASKFAHCVYIYSRFYAQLSGILDQGVQSLPPVAFSLDNTYIYIFSTYQGQRDVRKKGTTGLVCSGWDNPRRFSVHSKTSHISYQQCLSCDRVTSKLILEINLASFFLCSNV